ncbi:hypothetical protein TIFTF001_026225 [Ficus carica]|uniref:Retrotransposon gag domain-containing protein n=1 Tax=Ficus carica TaxID=3494 RepID=A0AA88DKZ3_FICCA|nr:hypothetical protein TIFTF001_026225 [Ficus carica]
MSPIRGSSSEDTLLSRLGVKITAAFRTHIESLCSSCGITRGAWSRLAVIQLSGPARRWWESIGQDLNLVHWRDFRRYITEYFVGPFLYRERMADLTYAQGRRFFTRAVRWAPVHGESMQEYKRQFKEDLLVECPYELHQEDACELFWQGVPHEIRTLVYFSRSYLDYDHLCSEVSYAEKHLRGERVNTPPTRKLENVEDATMLRHQPHTNQKPWETMMPALVQKRRTPPKFSPKEKMTRLMVIGDACVIFMIYVFPMIDYDQLNTRVIYKVMVRPRAAVARRPQEANLAEMVFNLQRRLEDQECEIENLREQLTQQNEEVPPPPPPTSPAQPVAPAVPAAQAAQPVI